MRAAGLARIDALADALDRYHYFRPRGPTSCATSGPAPGPRSRTRAP